MFPYVLKTMVKMPTWIVNTIPCLGADRTHRWRPRPPRVAGTAAICSSPHRRGWSNELYSGPMKLFTQRWELEMPSLRSRRSIIRMRCWPSWPTSKFIRMRSFKQVITRSQPRFGDITGAVDKSWFFVNLRRQLLNCLLWIYMGLYFWHYPSSPMHSWRLSK